MPTFSQVSDDNEDGVVKMNADRSRYDFVEGQVLVKFKDESPVKVSKARGLVTTNVGQLTSILEKYGANEMEKVLPNEKPGRQLRKSRAFNGETIQEKDLSQLYCVKLGDSHRLEVLEAVKELKDLDEVEFAEPNYKLHTLATLSTNYNNNPNYSSQWYLTEYGVKDLWSKPIINNERPVIAILDTGVDITHPDLKDNLWTNKIESEGLEGVDNDGNGLVYDIHGWDFINNTGVIRDNNKHGTHVAGIAAASDNSLGIIGANPLAYIMPVTVMQSDGTGDVATIIKGIDYAVSKGASVLNLSLGTYANSLALRQALEKAYQTAVIVAAAGNDFCRIHFSPNCHPGKCGYGVMFPAGYSFVLGVQATVQGGALAGFSNHDCDGPNFSSASTFQDPDGFNYELSAPGANIISTIPGGKYENLNGTSMAAPLVAGAISALKMVKQYDTQEILWGDLLHSSNILGAYNMTSRPAELDIMKLQMFNRKELSEMDEDDYSGDHEIDAGETVNIYPVIRTTFGEATNIKMKLEIGEYEDLNVVTINTANANFGLHLDAYGKGVSVNPLTLTIPKTVADARHIKLRITAFCDENPTPVVKDFVIVVTNMVKINGLISEDMTLTADHTYLVNENLGIMEGATLTIEPGTRIEVMEGMGISSFGKLIAKGTPEKPITFTRHAGEGPWKGIKSHKSKGEHNHDAALYTNDAKTLFTLLPTDATPNKFTDQYKYVYYGANEDSPSKTFWLSDYIKDFSSDMTPKQEMLTDPNYLTPAVLQMLSEWEAYWSQYPTQWSADKPNSTSVGARLFSWEIYDNPRDTISYCRIEEFDSNDDIYYPYMKDCVISPAHNTGRDLFYNLEGQRNTIMNAYYDYIYLYGSYNLSNLKYSNIVNNYSRYYAKYLPRYSQMKNLNYINNFGVANYNAGKYTGKEYSLAIDTEQPTVDKAEDIYSSYLGTARKDLIRPFVYEIGNAPNTYGEMNLDNMPSRPYAEPHGIVWKVVVNEKDAQDEFEDLPPLGVGKHKFEVYFNRPMNKAVAPQISFGVRDPWTQQIVAEDGSWNTEGTVYTAWKTIDGKTKSDGLNRIYVYGAQDNEFFEIPYEKTRFNIIVQAAGSMATGFSAEAGLGKVSLTWDNTNNNFDDAMGFNVYRYGSKMKTVPAHYENGKWVGETQVPDTVRLNENILDISAKSFVDYEVTPGETYYYYYKVLSTDLQEYDISNVVAATPLTSTLGDANGSGDVNVTDVVWTVNYAVGMDPKPFIFEAADVNTDQTIDILDVVGIVNLAMSAARPMTRDEAAQAVYTIENGMLYVETPISLAGLQVQFSVDNKTEMKAADGLKGFEQASTWLTDNDYMLMAYNFGKKTLEPGKHALLYIGDAELTDIRVSDVAGQKVNVVAGSGTTAIDGTLLTKTLNKTGIYNLNGQKVAGNADRKLQHGVYIINGQKVVK